MKKYNVPIEEIIAIAIISLLMVTVLLFSGCTSFEKIKSKYGNKTIEIETIPYQKEIAADSATLYTRLDGLRPNIPFTVSSDRSRITLLADASGGLMATAYSAPIYIRDSFPYPVEKAIFKEADLDKYILKANAEKEKKLAVEMALLQGQVKQVKKENKLTFFDKVKNTVKDIGLGLGLVLLVLFIVMLFAKKLFGKFFPLLLILLLFLFGCAHFDLSRPFVVEGIRYESGEVYYELSQARQNGKKQYALIREEAGAKKLFDTVYLQPRDIRFLK